MLHQIAPRRADITYRNLAPRDNDRVVALHGHEILLAENPADELFPTAAMLPEALRAQADYLLAVDDAPYFCLSVEEAFALQGYAWRGIRALREVTMPVQPYVGSVAYHYHTWVRGHRYCGVCGTLLAAHTAERARVCPTCGTVVYPTIAPSVIVCITDAEERILLTRYNPRHAPGLRYALVAGYVELGETPEQTVAREAMEEVGLRLKNIRYITSQPWGFSGAMLLGYAAEVEGDTTIRRNPEELSEAAWFSRDTLPENVSPQDSLTGWMIARWRMGQL